MSKSINENLATMLRQVRKDSGFTQVEFAKKIGCSRETIIAVEKLHPGTIQSLEMGFVARWWFHSKFAATIETKTKFVYLVKKAMHIE